ncbi:MAG: hypothetical protein AB8G05_16895 [Oligoflexales bacterium]
MNDSGTVYINPYEIELEKPTKFGKDYIENSPLEIPLVERSEGSK